MLIGSSIAAPWAHYTNAGASFGGGLWADVSGNGRNAASSGSPVLDGRTIKLTTSDSITFPAESLAENFTIFIAARYTPGGASQRILQNVGFNWLLGWFFGNEGVAFFAQWMTSAGEPLPATPDFNYRIVAGRNSPIGDTVWVDGVNVSTSSGGAGDGQLVINPGLQNSDCEVQEVIIFDGHLIDEDVVNISSLIGTYTLPHYIL